MSDPTVEMGLLRLVGAVLARPVERLALFLVAITATIATFAEATVLVVMSLAALRLSDPSVSSIELPLGLPLDELATNRLLTVGVVALVLRLLVLLVNAYVSARITASVLYTWRERLFRAFQRAPWETQSGLDDGYMQTLTQTHVARVSAMVNQLSVAITAGISFATFALGALVISPLGALGLVSFGALIFVLLRPLTRLLQKRSTEERTAAKEYARLLGEASGMSLEHRLLGTSEAVSLQLRHELAQQCVAVRRQKVLQKMTPQLYTAIGYLAILLGIGFASRLDTGQVAALGAIVLMMLRSIGYGQSFQSTTQTVAASAPYAKELLKTVTDMESSQRPLGGADPGTS